MGKLVVIPGEGYTLKGRIYGKVDGILGISHGPQMIFTPTIVLGN